ncbi:unnamed protein product [Macrosiphum euphorbiae]|uniref:Uncharacterized protein n=1 Tax=Macrosiphum euphorbiae TaxID=13131 RepID=A0AAV0WEI0_9HEMI|nr:unnamed protein product [Macrosiphum euphorbiae]
MARPRARRRKLSPSWRVGIEPGKRYVVLTGNVDTKSGVICSELNSFVVHKNSSIVLGGAVINRGPCFRTTKNGVNSDQRQWSIFYGENRNPKV